MKKLIISSLLFYTALLDAADFIINTDHSTIKFSIKYMIISHVEGRFEKFHGTFQFDEQTNSLKNVQIIIYPSSIDTDNKMRDAHLKKRDFFYTKKFPIISFKSSNIKKKSNIEYIIIGNLTIKNVTKETQFSLKLIGKNKDTWNNINYFFEFSSLISRSSFALHWNKTLESGKYLVGDKVNISGVIQGQPQGEQTASSKHLIPDNKQTRVREKINRKELPALVFKTKSKSQNFPSKTLAINSLELQKKTAIPPERPGKTLAFILFTFFGFVGTLFLVIFSKLSIKKIFAQYYDSELSLMAFLADAIAMAFLATFAYCTYEILTLL